MIGSNFWSTIGKLTISSLLMTSLVTISVETQSVELSELADKDHSKTPSFLDEPYGPIDGLDTLWNIAKIYAPDDSLASISRMMHEIYKHNKSAFLNGDIDLLMKGQFLKIPNLPPRITEEKVEIKQPSKPVPPELEKKTSVTPKGIEREFDKKIDHLNQQISTLSTTVKDYEKKTEEQKTHIESLQADNKKYQSELETVEKKLDSMYSMMTASVNSLQIMSDQISQNAIQQKAETISNDLLSLLRNKIFIFSMIGVLLLLIVVFVLLRISAHKKNTFDDEPTSHSSKKTKKPKKKEPIIEAEPEIEHAMSASFQLEKPIGAKTSTFQQDMADYDTRSKEVADPLAEVERCKSYKDYNKAEQLLVKALGNAPHDRELHLALFNLYVEINDKEAFKNRFEQMYEFISSDSFLRESVYNIWRVAWPEAGLNDHHQITRPEKTTNPMLSPELARLAELARETTQEPRISRTQAASVHKPGEKSLNATVMLQKARDLMAMNDYVKAEKMLDSVIKSGDLELVNEAKRLMGRIRHNSRILKQLNRKTFGRDSGVSDFH